jgi:DNA-directed RNA polymerase specialized sigma24 family protein
LTTTNFNGFVHLDDTISKVSSLVEQARSGDVDSFIQLYDAYVEGIYRSVYLRVINDTAAEGITLQVFCNAWEQLEEFQKYDLSFSTWIYKIARNQVMDYYKTNKKKHTVDVGFLSVAASRGLNQEIRGRSNPEARLRHPRFLTTDQQQTLISKYFNTKPTDKYIAQIKAYLKGNVRSLQMKTLQTLATFLEDLNLEHEVKPSPTFIAYTRSWLNQYLRLHTRRTQSSSSTAWRGLVVYAVLILAFLVTGTAKAQSALPGDLLYGWKRTSEQALSSVSFDPVGTDIMLANRRLNEWIAVRNDPARSAIASNDYYDALARLNSMGGTAARVRMISMLNTHRQRLDDSGLSAAQFDNFLIAGAYPTPSMMVTLVSPTEVVRSPKKAPTQVAGAATGVPPGVPPLPPPPPEVPTVVAPPPTDAPTEVPPPATEAPTQAPPPATEAATQVPPPATEASTEAPQPTTEAPTKAPPPATEAPPAVPPPATDAPPQAPPPATDAPAQAPPPVGSTDVPVTIPTGAAP